MSEMESIEDEAMRWVVRMERVRGVMPEQVPPFSRWLEASRHAELFARSQSFWSDLSDLLQRARAEGLVAADTFARWAAGDDGAGGVGRVLPFDPTRRR